MKFSERHLDTICATISRLGLSTEDMIEVTVEFARVTAAHNQRFDFGKWVACCLSGEDATVAGWCDKKGIRFQDAETEYRCPECGTAAPMTLDGIPRHKRARLPSSHALARLQEGT